ncbi:MAG: DegV family protein [Lachnospiraceae bacterium]|nr:DegV family protein [Lachnospiraceae bacterium]
MLVLFADTDTDMTPEIAEKYGYRIISMPYVIDGEETAPYEDFEVFDSHAFYDRLRGGTIPGTSAISEERYRRYFEPVFKNGDDILYVHFSAAMTNTFTFMNQAVEKLLKAYPERHFYHIDTKGISITCLSMALVIGEMAKEGKDIREILHFAETEVDHFATYFFADDLKFFQRSGRVSGLSATMGSLLGIRPIIYINDEGKMVSIGKEKGRKKALDRLIAYMEELGDDIGKYRVLVGHSDNAELAELLKQKIRERFGADLEIVTSVVNPTIGSHCGPDAIGVCFHAKHR